MDEEALTSSNLAVGFNEYPAAIAEVRGRVQRFLAKEYAHVLVALRDNRHLLAALAQRLVVDRIVDQGEMRAILGCTAADS